MFAFSATFIPRTTLPSTSLNRITSLHNTPRCCANSSASTQTISLPRRSVIQVSLLAAASGFLPQKAASDEQFSTYKGPISLGFSFQYPTSWTVKKKPIRTHITEIQVTSDKQSSTTAGVVVDAVKIDTIDKFGTPDAVGQKVVELELKKDSVSAASCTSATSTTSGGLIYYVLDYTVDSSRGVKRYLAKVTVTGGQLYVLTAQANADDYGEISTTFKSILDSFNVVKQYA